MNFYIELNGRKRRLSIDPAGEGYALQLDGEPFDAEICRMQANVVSVLIEGRSYRVLFDPRSEEKAVVLGESRIPYQQNDPRSLRSRANADASDSGKRSIVASMPGRIVRVLVKVGDAVEARQGLIVVEAMKMQNELKSPRAGNVARIDVEVGATVQAGGLLLVIE